MTIVKNLPIIILVLFCSALKAQTTKVIPSPELAKMNGDTTYNYVGEWPQYPGGHQKMNQFLSENIQYPKKAARKNIEGKVLVGFTIQTDGSITDIYIIKSVESSLDEEAIRVVSLMPKWIPGKNNGVPVMTKHQITISYKL